MRPTAAGRQFTWRVTSCVRPDLADVLARLPGITPHKLVSRNASEIADGAGAAVIADRLRAEHFGLPTRCLASYGVCGVERGS
jgi:hypothetical protein